MKVKMLKNTTAAFDGINISRLEAGNVYEMPEKFANAFIGRGIAEQEGGKKVIDVEIETAVQEKPKNKMLDIKTKTTRKAKSSKEANK